MATKYVYATDAVYEALELCVNSMGASPILYELFYWLNADEQTKFIHFFLQDYSVDTSVLSEDCLNAIEEHYRLHC